MRDAVSVASKLRRRFRNVQRWGARFAHTASRLRGWIGAVGTLGVVLFGHGVAFAAVSYQGGFPSVGSSNLTNGINGALTTIAVDIRNIGGVTALLAIVVAAIMNHFVHDQQAKDKSKELIKAAIVGLLLFAFAPAIVNFFMGIGNHVNA